MKRWGVPDDYIQMLAFAQHSDGWPQKRYKCCEWMCGVRSVGNAFEAQELDAFGYDIEIDEHYMNFEDDDGYINATGQSRHLESRGLQHWDTVCTSWIWMCRKITKRDPILRPLGDTNVGIVKSGNVQVSRMCLIALKDLARQCPFLLEQPGSSLMKSHPRMTHLDHASLDLFIAEQKALNDSKDLQVSETHAQGLFVVPTWMARFGADHAKKTLLITSHFGIAAPLFRTMTAKQRLACPGEVTTDETIVVLPDGTVQRKVTGRKEALRGQ